MFALRVQTADGPQTIELGMRPVILGRSDACDIVLRNDGEVSREHAQVWVEAGTVLVSDSNSKNGTRVDNGELFRNEVRPAAECIRIGGYDISILGSTAGADLVGVRYQPDAPTGMGNTKFLPSSRPPALINQKRLGLLMGLTDRIGGVFEKRQLMEQALDACCEALDFERGLIALKARRGETEEPVTRNVQRDENGAYKVSRTLINRALVEGERAIVNNPATDLVDNLSESLVRFPICSALCVPIQHRDDILGVIYGDRITRAATYTDEDVDFFAAIAQQVAVGLANLRLFESHVQSQKIYASLEQARTIQRRLLPSKPLTVPGVAITGMNRPSTSVGGDYFDYFSLDEQRVGLIIADVTGHGLPSALIMANFQAAVHVALTPTIPLPELGERLNQLVFRNTPAEVFITAIIARLDVPTGRIEFISAGHPGPIVFGDGGPVQWEDEQETNALPFGVLPTDEYQVQLLMPDAACNALLFYTDGLTEAENAAGNMLGAERVADALRGLPNPGAPELIDATLALVGDHVGEHDAAQDDLTLMALRYDPENVKSRSSNGK